ncbi:MAG: hypothetical protein IJJ33_08625 [Victivallales bacterium]|nr:hypothetical protein [Victivallales bacterium]
MNSRSVFSWLLALLTLGVTAFAQPADTPPPGDGEGLRPPAAKPEWQGKRPPHRKPGEWLRGEDILLLMNKLKKENPEEFKRLDELRRTDRAQFFGAIRKYMPKRMPFNAEVMRNEQACRELARKIHTSTEVAEKERLTKELREKLAANFDLMVENAEQRLKQMQERLTALRENRQEILEERYKSYVTAGLDESLPPPPPPRE